MMMALPEAAAAVGAGAPPPVPALEAQAQAQAWQEKEVKEEVVEVVSDHLADFRLEDTELRREAVRALFSERGLLSRFHATKIDPTPCRRWTKVRTPGGIAAWKPMAHGRGGAAGLRGSAAKGSAAHSQEASTNGGDADGAFLTAATMSLLGPRMPPTGRQEEDEEDEEQTVAAAAAGTGGGRQKAGVQRARSRRGGGRTAKGDDYGSSEEELVLPRAKAAARPERKRDEELWAQFDLKDIQSLSATVGGPRGSGSRDHEAPKEDAGAAAEAPEPVTPGPRPRRRLSGKTGPKRAAPACEAAEAGEGRRRSRRLAEITPGSAETVIAAKQTEAAPAAVKFEEAPRRSQRLAEAGNGSTEAVIAAAQMEGDVGEKVD